MNPDQMPNELNEQRQKQIEEKLDAVLMHGPMAIKSQVLSYLDICGFILSANKIRMCSEIIALVELLMQPERERETAYFLVTSMEEHIEKSSVEMELDAEQLLRYLRRRSQKPEEN